MDKLLIYLVLLNVLAWAVSAMIVWNYKKVELYHYALE